MPKAGRQGVDWDIKVRVPPAAKRITELVLSHGWSAAHERWGWLDHQTLSNIVKAAIDPDQVPEDYEVPDLEP